MKSDKTPKINKFIRRLYKIVNDNSFSEIQWTTDGLRFYITDKTAFMLNGLKYLSKTTEYSAFVRLLYVYGFSKSKSLNAYEEEYYHKNFKRDGDNLLPCIQRTVETKTTLLQKNTNRTPNQLQDLLQYLNNQNFKLEGEIKSLKDRVDQQDCTINGLVQLLTRIFRTNDSNKDMLLPLNITEHGSPINNELRINYDKNQVARLMADTPNIDGRLENTNIELSNNKNFLFDSDDEDSIYKTNFF
ncbi:hypothetical protein NCER_100004 [Vairimorpha ceranae BRL01]|uniref:Probable heat shock transcription factor n=2 Tax=Vairimorpha ceranae TaxID=40302 RepID=HSF_VAIC1|nr:heat shock transcription factor [Vairimorpha ceranae]C4V6H6.1 RecName: Full=Probable heat shock transcription factor; Short=HSTF; AltName: Full=Heat shock factor protein; Short=HSF [Vairimorpha ceranae BRL01]EEQ83147.1 hypothetical protein NCER_100004 [Vairimorpha ceranae BRL01]KAF5140668.1 hypothetical protein G9O61_00g011640 [Vairimorpha ceranae]KKO75679.1 heat shock transcription factor [Vairimorpha ceranae]